MPPAGIIARIELWSPTEMSIMESEMHGVAKCLFRWRSSLKAISLASAIQSE
jgi:hypothetical protein